MVAVLVAFGRANWESQAPAAPDPLIEPDDMVIVEPPCHPNEPPKVPENSTERIHCLVCGTAFAA